MEITSFCWKACTAPACTAPTPTFSSAFARALLWWLPRPAGLHWGAKAASAIDTRVTDRLISPAKSFSEASALYLVSSKIQLSYLKWKLQQTKDAARNPSSTKPLSDEPHRLYYSLSCPPQTYPESFTTRRDQREGMAGKRLMSNVHSFFELKI